MNASESGDYREIVGTFHNSEDLERAVSTLSSAGWDRSEMSLLAQRGVLFPEHVKANTETLADDPKAERDAVISDPDIRQGRTLAASMIGLAAAFLASGATIMTGGAVLAAVIGAAAAGGGAAAIVEGFGRWADTKHTNFLREQIKGGGILLWAKLDRPEQEETARSILAECGAANVHVHESDTDLRVASQRH